MEKRKEVVLFKPSEGPDPDACPKCKTHMEDFDGADIKGRNHRGKFCPKCRWFVGIRYDKGHRPRGKFDPKKRDRFSREFEGRIRPKRRGRNMF